MRLIFDVVELGLMVLGAIGLASAIGWWLIRRRRVR